MTLREKIEEVFAGRQIPAEVIDSQVTQFDSDVDEAKWFQGRDWHQLTRTDWQQHSSAIHFFSPEAFCYYLPSLLLVSAEDPMEWLYATDGLLFLLDLSPSVEGWPDHIARRFVALRPKELDVVKEWLLLLCEYPTYRGYGISASGAGDKFGRAFETVNLVQRELERKRVAG